MSSAEGADRVSNDQDESISVVQAIGQAMARSNSLNLDLMTLQIVAHNRESESKEAREFNEFKIERLETLLQTERIDSSRAKHDLQRLGEKMGDLNIEFGEMKVEMTQCKIDAQNQHAKWREENATLLQSHNAQLDLMQRRIENEKAEKFTLFQNHNAQLNDIQRQLEDEQESNKVLKEDMTKVKSMLDETLEDSKLAHEKCAEWAGIAGYWKDKALFFSSEVVDVRKEHASQSEKYKTLQETFETQKSRLQEEQNDNLELEVLIESKNKQITKLSKEKEDLEGNMNSMAQEKRDLLSQNVRLAEEIATLNDDKTQLRGQTRSLRNDNRALRNEKGALEKLVDKTRGQRNCVKKQLKQALGFLTLDKKSWSQIRSVEKMFRAARESQEGDQSEDRAPLLRRSPAVKRNPPVQRAPHICQNNHTHTQECGSGCWGPEEDLDAGAQGEEDRVVDEMAQRLAEDLKSYQVGPDSDGFKRHWVKGHYALNAGEKKRMEEQQITGRV